MATAPAVVVAAVCAALAVVLVVGTAGRSSPARLRGAGPTTPGTRAETGARAGPGAARSTGSPGSVDHALAADLMAAAMLAGAPATVALDVVGAALGGAGEQLRQVAALLAMGADEATAWSRTDPGWAPLARCLALSASSGAPGAALLHQAAQRSRAERAARRRAAAQRLEVLVLLPMGLCALPAFAALGVVPLVLALAGALVGW